MTVDLLYAVYSVPFRDLLDDMKHHEIIRTLSIDS
jgi:hypothetical protein